MLLAANNLATVAKPSPTDLISSNINLIKRNYSKSHKPKKVEIDVYLESDSDSDSDDEKYRPKKKVKYIQLSSILLFQNINCISFFCAFLQGNSDFWRRKMRTLHALLDVNNDGVISFEDFQLLAKNFTALGHLSPEAQQEFLTVLKSTWESQWGEISPYNLVNAEQYLTQMHHAINDKDLACKIHSFLPYLFKVSSVGC